MYECQCPSYILDISPPSADQTSKHAHCRDVQSVCVCVCVRLCVCGGLVACSAGAFSRFLGSRADLS